VNFGNLLAAENNWFGFRKITENALTAMKIANGIAVERFAITPSK
jgi:hypothetical protein